MIIEKYYSLSSNIKNQEELRQQNQEEVRQSLMSTEKYLQSHAVYVHNTLEIAKTLNVNQSDLDIELDQIIIFSTALLDLNSDALSSMKRHLGVDIVSDKKVCFTDQKYVCNFRDLFSPDVNFVKDTCGETSLDTNTSQNLESSDLPTVLRLVRTHKYLKKKHSIKATDIEEHLDRINVDRKSLDEIKTGEIKFPFFSQPINITLALYIGPIFIIMVQFLISSYYRHRYDLIEKIYRLFSYNTNADDIYMKENIHLFMWPYIMNFPNLKFKYFLHGEQKDETIIKMVLVLIQMFPLFAVGLIIIRSIHLLLANSDDDQDLLLDITAILFFTILWWLLYRQVWYSIRLDQRISALLAWKEARGLDETFARPVRRPHPIRLCAMLIFGGVFANAVYFLPSFYLDFSLIPLILIIFVGYRFGKVWAGLFGGLVAGLWVIVRLSVEFETGLAAWGELLYGRFFSLGLVRIVYSSPYDLVCLSLLGFLSGWLVQRTREHLAQARISLQEIFSQALRMETGFSLRKSLWFLIAIILMVIANVIFRPPVLTDPRATVTFPPGGLAIVACLAFGYLLGPHGGRLAGIVAISISILATFSYPFIASNSSVVQLQFRQLGHLCAFGLIGYWAGYTRLLIQHTAILRQLGTTLSLARQEAATPIHSRSIVVFVPILALCLMHFSLRHTEAFSLNFFPAIPLWIVVVMLMGVYCGSRRAVWITGITLSLLALLVPVADYWGWPRPIRLPQQLTLIVRLESWSAVGVILLMLAAYVSGQIELVQSRRNRYWLVIAIFAAFELSSILRLVHFHERICATGDSMLRLVHETTDICSSLD